MRKSRILAADVTSADAIKLIDKPRVLALCGNIGDTTLYQWQRDLGFPAPLELGPPGGRSSTSRWIEAEVIAWIKARPRREVGRGRHEYRGPVDQNGKPSPVPRGKAQA